MSKSKRQRVVIAVSAALIAGGVLSATTNVFPRFGKMHRMERLRTDTPKDLALGVHDGELYYLVQRMNDENKVYRTPVTGGSSEFCFIVPKGARVQDAKDGLYVLQSKIEPQNEQNLPPNWSKLKIRELGDFSLSPPQEGEKRTVYTYYYSINKPDDIRAWCFMPKEKTLQPVTVREAFRAIYPHGRFVVKADSQKFVAVINKDGVRNEFPPVATLVYESPDGSQPRVIARNLTVRSSVQITDAAACWYDMPRYHAAKRTFPPACYITNGTSLTLPKQLEYPPDVASAQGDLVFLNGFWQAYVEKLWVMPVGATQAQLVVAPLPEGETGTLRYRHIYQVGGRFYLQCDLQRKDENEDLSNNRSSSTLPYKSEKEDSEMAPLPSPPHAFLIRVYPERAGKAGFWGGSVMIPYVESSSNQINTGTIMFDNRYVYIKRPETDKGIVTSLRNLFSYEAVEVDQNVLYRVELP